MISLTSVQNKLEGKGFRRSGKSFDYNLKLSIIDYEHPRRNDMYALFVDEFLGSVKYIEHTTFCWNSEVSRYIPVVKKIENLGDFNKTIG